MFNYLALSATVVFSVLANILLKKGSFAVETVPMTLRGAMEFILLTIKNLYVLGGLALLGAAFFIWVWLLSRMQLNIMYPVALSAQMLLLSLTSWLLFKESLSVVQISGVMAIILGILLLVRPQ